ncbi:hypothetical protein LHK12_11800 [Providencia rettgeri]|nr:hypothetical protein [Providencia rettgeri]
MLSGKWLKEMGFEVGCHYTLTRQAGQLIIRLAEGSKIFKENLLSRFSLFHRASLSFLNHCKTVSPSSEGL